MNNTRLSTFCIIILILVTGSQATSSPATGTIISNNDNIPSNDVHTSTTANSWILPPESKVTLNSIPKQDMIGTDSASMYLARNEEEYVQIAMEGALSNIDISIKSDFSGPAGTINGTQFEFYQEYFIKVTEPSWDSQEGNIPTYLPINHYYADGLVPFTDPYDSGHHPGRGFNIKSGEVGAILVKVFANDQAPGIYQGVLQVSSNEKTFDIDLKIVIFDFTIPNSTLDTVYYVEYGYKSIADLEGVAENSAAHNALREKYYKLLTDYGLFPGNVLPVPSYDVATQTIDFGEAETMINYMLDHGMKAVGIPNYYDDLSETYLDGSEVAKFDDADWRAEAVAYYRAWANWLDSKGLLERCYAFISDETQHVSDEPYHLGQKGYDRVWEWADLLYEANPKIRFLFADNILPISTLEEYKDVRKHDIPLILDVYGADIDTSGIQPFIDDYKADGKYLWYVNNDNYDFIDYSGIHPRVMGAFSYLHGITGIEAWDTISWPEDSTDPWVDNPANPFGNGAGAIIYPGKHWSIKGPVPSLRMELNREALDDHAYLSLLESLGAPDLAKSIVQRMVPSDIMWVDNTDVSSQTILNAKMIAAAQILRLNKSSQINEGIFPDEYTKEYVTISGTVTFEGSPAQGIVVGDGYGMGTTDVAGKYSFVSIPGNHTLDAIRYDRRSMVYSGNIESYADYHLPITTIPGDTKIVDIQLKASDQKVDMLTSFENDYTDWSSGGAKLTPTSTFPVGITATDGNQMLKAFVSGDSEITVYLNISGNAGSSSKDEIWLDIYTGSDKTYTIMEIAVGESWEFYREVYMAPGGPYTIILPLDKIAELVGSLDGKVIPIVFSIQTTVGEGNFESSIGDKTIYFDEMLYVHSSDSSITLSDQGGGDGFIDGFEGGIVIISVSAGVVILMAAIFYFRRKRSAKL